MNVTLSLRLGLGECSIFVTYTFGGKFGTAVFVGGGLVAGAGIFVGASVGTCVEGVVAVGNKVGSSIAAFGSTVMTMTVMAGSLVGGTAVSTSVGGIGVRASFGGTAAGVGASVG